MRAADPGNKAGPRTGAAGGSTAPNATNRLLKKSAGRDGFPSQRLSGFSVVSFEAEGMRS